MDVCCLPCGGVGDVWGCRLAVAVEIPLKSMSSFLSVTGNQMMAILCVPVRFVVSVLSVTVNQVAAPLKCQLGL